MSIYKRFRAKRYFQNKVKAKEKLIRQKEARLRQLEQIVNYNRNDDINRTIKVLALVSVVAFFLIVTARVLSYKPTPKYDNSHLTAVVGVPLDSNTGRPLPSADEVIRGVHTRLEYAKLCAKARITFKKLDRIRYSRPDSYWIGTEFADIYNGYRYELYRCEDAGF